MGRDKEKNNKYSKKWRANNKERIKNYNHEYRKKNSTKIKEWGLKWREKNKEERRVILKQYHQDNKEKEKRYRKEYYKKNRERILERQKQNYKKYYAITYKNPKFREHKRIWVKVYRKIKIPMGYLCDLCKTNIATQRHHPDYSKPLEVKLLCCECHLKEHGKEIYKSDVKGGVTNE